MMRDIKNYLNSKPWSVLFFEISTYLFVATLPLYLNLNTIALWALVLGSLITLKKKVWLHNLLKNKQSMFALLLLFGLYVLGLFLSKDTGRVVKDIGRTIPLCVLPFIILTHRKEEFNIKRIYSALGVGLFVGMLICWYHIIVSIMSRENYMKQATYFFEWIYTDRNLVKPLDGHPSYFAILIVLFLGAILTSKHFNTLRKNKLKCFILVAPFFLFLIETSSRIGVIGLVVILCAYSLKKINLKSLTLVSVILITISIFAFKFDYLGSKFNKLIDLNGEIKFERYLRWKEIFKVFDEKNKWILGTGSGDARLVYRRAYYNGGFDLALRENYNAHNQYLEFLVCNGIIGLLLYVFILFLFAQKTKLKNEALVFFIIMALFSISESFLGRSQGVFIFAFFYSMLIVSSYNPLKKNILQ